MPLRSVLKGAFRYTFVGILVLAPAIPLVHLLLNGLYRFELGTAWYIWGALMVLPVFAYSPLIYWMYGQGKERWVMSVNFAGAFINLLMTSLWIPEYNILGALAGSAVAQWAILGIYLYLLLISFRPRL